MPSHNIKELETVQNPAAKNGDPRNFEIPTKVFLIVQSIEERLRADGKLNGTPIHPGATVQSITREYGVILTKPEKMPGENIEMLIIKN